MPVTDSASSSEIFTPDRRRLSMHSPITGRRSLEHGRPANFQMRHSSFRASMSVLNGRPCFLWGLGFDDSMRITLFLHSPHATQNSSRSKPFCFLSVTSA